MRRFDGQRWRRAITKPSLFARFSKAESVTFSIQKWIICWIIYQAFFSNFDISTTSNWDFKEQVSRVVEKKTIDPDQFISFQIKFPKKTAQMILEFIFSLTCTLTKKRRFRFQTERRVHQVHFTGWPDHGVPSSVFPLLSFAHFVAQIHSTGPLLVHCRLANMYRDWSFYFLISTGWISLEIIRACTTSAQTSKCYLENLNKKVAGINMKLPRSTNF